MTQPLNKVKVTSLYCSRCFGFPLSRMFAPSLGVLYKKWCNSPSYYLDKGYFLSENKGGGKEHMCVVWHADEECLCRTLSSSSINYVFLVRVNPLHLSFLICSMGMVIILLQHNSSVISYNPPPCPCNKIKHSPSTQYREVLSSVIWAMRPPPPHPAWHLLRGFVYTLSSSTILWDPHSPGCVSFISGSPAPNTVPNPPLALMNVCWVREWLHICTDSNACMSYRWSNWSSERPSH